MALPDKRVFGVGPAWALALAGVLAWGPVAQAEEGAARQPTAEQVITGKVVDTAGKPIAGADVVFVARRFTDQKRETRTNQQGRFELKFPPHWVEAERHFSPMVVWAYATGHNLGAASAYKALDDKKKEEITITLEPETTVLVQILDPDGKPQTRGYVYPFTYNGQTRIFPLEDYVPVELAWRMFGEVNEKGLATLRGVNKDNLFRVRVNSPLYDNQFFRLPEGPKKTLSPFQLEKTGKLEGLIVGADPKWFNQIRVAVASEDRDGRNFMILPVQYDGRFYSDLVAKGDIQIIPMLEDGVPLVCDSLTKRTVKEGKKVRADILLVEGVLVTGRVVVKGKGTPVDGVWVTISKGFHFSAKAKTDIDGRFKVRAFPGTLQANLYNLPENLMDAGSPNPREVEVPSGKERVEIPPIEVVEAHEIRGTLVDERKEPLGGMEVIAKSGAFSSRTGISDKMGAFRLRVPEGMEVKLFAYNEDNETVEVKTLSKNPLKIQYIADKSKEKFEAERAKKKDVVLTGKVLLEGKPIEGVTLYFSRGIPRPEDQNRGNRLANGPELPARWYPQEEAKTDAEGRYRLTGLKGGDWYSIRVDGPKLTADMRWNYNYSKKLGEADSGEVALPDVRLIHWNQSLAGTVVDPQGKPVAGASVSTETQEKGMSVPNLLYDRDTPPWTKTGADGRFVLKNLPNEPLTIFAHMPSKKAEQRIRFPVRVPAEKNQQNIRVVLDPSLVEDE